MRGVCAPRFRSLVERFARNFVEAGELGASLAVEVDGRLEVDVWGGWADPGRAQPWRHDTVGVVFSNTKPATALCAHLLAEDGLLDLDRPLADYWPAFGDSARRAITPRMLLDHSAGLPAIRQPLPPGAAFDHECMVAHLEREVPFWEPGTRVGYHGLTFGWLVGELVRRVAGMSLGRFFAERVAGPLGLDFWIGLPVREEHRIATIVAVPPADAPRNRFEQALRDEPDSIPALYFRNAGGWRPDGFNTRAGRSAEIGAANGITNARSLARLYGTLACGGLRDGFRLIDAGRLASAVRVSSATHVDACLRVPTRFGGGFMRSMDNRAIGCDSAAFGDDAFGHVGAGGSLAFASPRHRLGFAYTMNRMGAGVLLNERAEGLVDETYRLLQEAVPVDNALRDRRGAFTEE